MGGERAESQFDSYIHNLPGNLLFKISSPILCVVVHYLDSEKVEKEESAKVKLQ